MSPTFSPPAAAPPGRRRRSLVRAAAGALLAAGVIAPAAQADVGRPTVGSVVDTNSPGRAQDYRVTSDATNVVDRLGVYLDGANTARRVVLALYANQNGAAGTRLAACTIAYPAAGRWNRCTFSGVSVTSGRTYWTAILHPAGSAGNLRYRNTTGIGRSFGSASAWLTAAPSTWANGPDWGVQTGSIYADASGTPAPGPTPTPAAQCADGADNDGDGKVDLADPGCSSSSDDSESPDPTPPPAPGTGTLPRDASFVGLDYFTRWSNGPRYAMTQFPIGVFNMNPGAKRADGTYDAQHWRDLGINTYVSLWDYLRTVPDTTSAIRTYGGQAWDHDGGSAGQDVQKTHVGADEPDGRNISPAQNKASNDAMRAGDPSRPVYQNFTKGIYPGKWTTETDKRAWCASADIVSLDFYAATDPWEDDAGELGPYHYGRAVDALERYCPGKPALAFMETSQPFSDADRIQPWEFEAGVWNQIVHGARGLEYFVHDFYTPDGGSNLWTDAVARPIADRMKAVNAQVTSFSPQLNAPTVSGISATGQGGVPVATLGKDDGGKLWLLAQADGDDAHKQSNTTPMQATIQLPPAVPAGAVFDVVGENRTLTVNASNQLVDTFGTTGSPATGYQKHVYRQR